MARLDTKAHQTMGDWRIGSLLDVCWSAEYGNKR
jgi:hypothetical protein